MRIVSQKANMIYSKANRRQLISSDMAFSLVLIFQECCENEEAMIIIRKISSNIIEIQSYLYHGQKLILKTKDLKKYKQTILSIRNMIDDMFEGTKEMNLNFISGVLAVCCDQNEEVQKNSKNLKYMEAWDRLNNNLQELYEMYDPELEEHESCLTGIEISNKIREIIRKA